MRADDPGGSSCSTPTWPSPRGMLNPLSFSRTIDTPDIVCFSATGAVPDPGTDRLVGALEGPCRSLARPPEALAPDPPRLGRRIRNASRRLDHVRNARASTAPRKAVLAGTPLEGAADVCKLSIVKQEPAPGTPGAGEGLGPTFLLGR